MATAPIHTRTVPRGPDRDVHTQVCNGSGCGCYLEGLAYLGVEGRGLAPGSVVVLRGADLDPDAMEHLAAELRRAAGHSQFVVVDLPAGAQLDVVHDPEAVANLLGLVRPNPPGYLLPTRTEPTTHGTGCPCPACARGPFSSPDADPGLA